MPIIEVKDYPQPIISPAFASPKNFMTDSDLVNSVVDLISPDIFR